LSGEELCLLVEILTPTPGSRFQGRAVLLCKEKPLAGHQVLLAEVSDRRALGAQLEIIEQAYRERTG